MVVRKGQEPVLIAVVTASQVQFRYCRSRNNSWIEKQQLLSSNHYCHLAAEARMRARDPLLLHSGLSTWKCPQSR
jgi:hypothetical protein